jgi:type I restriction enzyme S subunit
MSWKKIEFQDFIKLQRGFDLPVSKMKDGDVPVLGSNGIVGYHNETKQQPPGVVTGRSGTLGIVQFTGKPFWPHNTSLWVKDFKGNDPRFVYYKLQTLRLERFNGGASVPTLNRNVLDTLHIRIPDETLQKRLADFLSTYDFLIENNRRRIQLLEQAARLVYKEWFVRLRFPGHEHVKIKDGMPEGWEQRHLSDLVDTQYGYTETASQEPVGPKFLRGTDINKTSYIDWSSVPYCPENNLDFAKYSLKVGDIVVIRMADPGKVALIEKNIKAVFGSYLVRLTLKAGIGILPLYLFYVLSDDFYQGFISGASGGATRKSASANLLVDFNLFVPSPPLISLFVGLVSPLRRQIAVLLDLNALLRAARDLLLPRMMNGDIVV